jgi:hypothetical protein
MQAGARHPIPLRRLSMLIATVGALTCGAILPAGAQALAVPSVAADAIAGTGTAAAEVIPAAPPVTEDVTRPASPAPVHETVAPIVQPAAESVSAAPAAVPSKALRERMHHPISHIAATSSAKRASSDRGVHGPAPRAANADPSSLRSSPVHRAASVAVEAPAAPVSPTGAAQAPLSSAPSGAASGAAGLSFFFGGGCALLVAWLLLAGPFVRRRLSLVPVACRPAAFLLVLERPG